MAGGSRLDDDVHVRCGQRIRRRTDTANGTSIASSTSAARTATSSYTADDGRILQVINGTTKHTVRGVGTDVLSAYINGAWNKDSIYLGSRLLGEIRSTGMVRYFGTDQLGSVRVVFDAAGAVIGAATTCRSVRG